jgi:hypothetical protein
VLQNSKDIMRMTTRTTCRIPMQPRATSALWRHRSRRCGAQPLPAAQPLRPPTPPRPPHDQRPMQQRLQEADRQQSPRQRMWRMRGMPRRRKRRRRRSCWRSGMRMQPGAGVHTQWTRCYGSCALPTGSGSATTCEAEPLCEVVLAQLCSRSMPNDAEIWRRRRPRSQQQRQLTSGRPAGCSTCARSSTSHTSVSCRSS